MPAPVNKRVKGNIWKYRILKYLSRKNGDGGREFEAELFEDGRDFWEEEGIPELQLIYRQVFYLIFHLFYDLGMK